MTRLPASAARSSPQPWVRVCVARNSLMTGRNIAYAPARRCDPAIQLVFPGIAIGSDPFCGGKFDPPGSGALAFSHVGGTGFLDGAARSDPVGCRARHGREARDLAMCETTRSLR